MRRVRRISWSEVRRVSCPDVIGIGTRDDGLEGRLLRFDIEADAFCHQMVRSLVAMLVLVGRGGENAAGVVARLRSGLRAGMPRPAPPGGLCLVAVRYPTGPGLPPEDLFPEDLPPEDLSPGR